MENGYPGPLVERIISEDPPVNPRPAIPPCVTCCLPYIPGLSQPLVRCWRRLALSSGLAIPEVRFVHRPMAKLGSIVSHPYQNAETREIVYKVQCSCSKVYIGETGRYLSTRLHEHSHRNDSEIFRHAEQLGHAAQMDGGAPCWPGKQSPPAAEYWKLCTAWMLGSIN